MILPPVSAQLLGNLLFALVAAPVPQFRQLPRVALSVLDRYFPAEGLPARTAVMELALDCGSFLVPARSDEHDAAAAAISHLPHLVAEAVALTAGEVPLAFALAAGSFRDVTRVAASTPELVRAFCEANADQVLPVLHRTIELLTHASTALAQNGSIADLVDGGHAARTRYDSFSRSEITGVVIGDEGWRQTLAAAGRAGGVIRSVPPVRDSPG